MANTPEPDQNFRTPSTSGTLPRMKLPLTPGSADISVEGLTVFAKQIAVHSTEGGRVHIVYIPVDNDDDQEVDIIVADGWRSDTSVRRVMTLDAVVDGDTATVWGLFN